MTAARAEVGGWATSDVGGGPAYEVAHRDGNHLRRGNGCAEQGAGLRGGGSSRIGFEAFRRAFTRGLADTNAVCGEVEIDSTVRHEVMRNVPPTMASNLQLDLRSLRCVLRTPFG
jgi:hypothetical protein